MNGLTSFKFQPVIKYNHKKTIATIKVLPRQKGTLPPMWAHRPGKGQDLRGRDRFGVVHQPARLGGPQSAGLQLGDFYTGYGLDRLRAVFVLHRCARGGSLQTDMDQRVTARVSQFLIYKILQVFFIYIKTQTKLIFWTFHFQKIILKKVNMIS